MATHVDTLSSRRVNLYEVLQVSPRAGQEVIQAAYRALARTYHPDVNDAPDAARQMRQLNAAYGVLSDPERRARYDAMRLPPARAPREAPARSALPPRPRTHNAPNAASPHRVRDGGAPWPRDARTRPPQPGGRPRGYPVDVAADSLRRPGRQQVAPALPWQLVGARQLACAARPQY